MLNTARCRKPFLFCDYFDTLYVSINSLECFSTMKIDKVDKDLHKWIGFVEHGMFCCVGISQAYIGKIFFLEFVLIRKHWHQCYDYILLQQHFVQRRIVGCC